MNWTPEDFERYVANKWMLAGHRYNLHGIYNFYESLWAGEASQLETLYGTVRSVETSTDYKDGLEERTMIVQVGDRFFKKVGYYNSWESSDWDGSLIEVKPVTKTVIVYEAV